ncbi:PREDICTED: uncharacterized protein LOC108496459 [Lepidothrix coronata]|uniref:Uncharacterized protein LOC108496459 n=1 Tax=Lepidothrix coronata TaxID=321398 RepID=A0A6J0H233_9PASS|nr:PREDICTED: uncharacterized protein LOC108496459 [Lepidothrix coronata]
MCQLRSTTIFGVVILGLVPLCGMIPLREWMSQPGENLWVTLAKATGTDTLCLSLASAGSPFRTCLVGIPITPVEWNSFVSQTHNKGTIPLNFPNLAQTIAALNFIDIPFQEIDLLGSLPTTACVIFHRYTQPILFTPHNVTANKQLYRGTTSPWCNNSVVTTIPTEHVPRNMRLPNGYFLLCGDGAWPGVRAYPEGGPCTVGKLALFNPAKF